MIPACAKPLSERSVNSIPPMRHFTPSVTLTFAKRWTRLCEMGSGGSATEGHAHRGTAHQLDLYVQLAGLKQVVRSKPKPGRSPFKRLSRGGLGNDPAPNP